MNTLALGGLTIDPNGSDFDAINAEKTARWAAEDAAKQGTRGPATGYLGYSGAPKASPLPVLDNPLSQPAGIDPTFQQDSDARQSRITAYADKLKTMEANGRANGLMGTSSTITRGFAGGGKIDPDELMRQMTAKYGAPYAGPVQQQGIVQPEQQPQQKPQALPQAQGLTPGIVGVLKGRQQQLDAQERKAMGYANGGKIKGKGTPTSDSISATVQETGEGISVSTEERILSEAQDAFLEEIAQASGFDSLNAMLEAGTGQKVGPTIKAGRRGAATGMAPEQEQRPEALGIDSRVATAIAAPPTLGGAPVARSEPSGGPLSSSARAGGYRPELDGLTAQPGQSSGAITFNSGPKAGQTLEIDQPRYTAADGTPTSTHRGSQENMQGIADAQNLKNQLATLQRMRLETDAFDPTITDQRVQINARQQLAHMDAQAGREGEAAGRMLDNQVKQAKLTNEGQMTALQSQYLAEADPARREALAERIRGVQGKGTAAAPVNLQHVETDRGTMVFDPRTGRMAPAVGADGQPVGSGKPLTEFQGKSTSFGMRADAASRVIDQVGQGGKVQPSLIKRAAEAVPLIGEGLGMAANSLQTPEQQQVEQAQRDFVNAVLRQESGAAVSAAEFDNARKQYFPQPGDSPEVVAQKKANRESAINGFRISAGPGARNIGGAPAQPHPQQQPAAAPKVGTVDGKHVFLGGNPADPASWAEVR